MKSNNALDAMLGKDCPWCQKQIAFPHGEPGLQVTPLPRKWHQFSKAVTACPFCGKPVKLAPQGQAWILLAFPSLLVPMSAALFGLQFSMLSWQFLITLPLTAVGGIQYLRHTRLERDNGI